MLSYPAIPYFTTATIIIGKYLKKILIHFLDHRTDTTRNPRQGEQNGRGYYFIACIISYR